MSLEGAIARALAGMSIDGMIRCAGCSAFFPKKYLTGRPRKYCEDCRPRKNGAPLPQYLKPPVEPERSWVEARCCVCASDFSVYMAKGDCMPICCDDCKAIAAAAGEPTGPPPFREEMQLYASDRRPAVMSLYESMPTPVRDFLARMDDRDHNLDEYHMGMKAIRGGTLDFSAWRDDLAMAKRRARREEQQRWKNVSTATPFSLSDPREDFD